MTINNSLEKNTMLRQQAIAYAEAALGHPLDQQPEQKQQPHSLRIRPPRDTRPLLIELLTERDGPNCYLCQEELNPDDTCVEHIIPISKGGTNTAANVALSCSNCNHNKSHMYVSIDADRRPRYHRR